MNLTGSLNAGYTTLNHSLKELRVQLDHSQSYWKDAVSERFDEEQWQPLEGRILAALRAMDRLAPVLIKMQQECE